MSIATASDLETAPARPLLTPLLSATACVALADWLFYDWQIGISLALFLGVLGAVAVAGNRVYATRTVQIVMAAIFAAGLLALIEDVNVLSVIVGALATALFVIVMTARGNSSWQWNLFEAAIAPLRGPFQLAGDLFVALQQMKQQVPEWLRMGSLIAWIVPLSVFAVFLGLFSSANPLIEHGLMQIDLRFLSNHSDLQRTLFWLFIACAIWPFIHRRIRRTPARKSEPSPAVAAEPSELDYLFGAQAMLRSLILFNALFALQTGLDLVYLWGGAALPDGLTYAEYAHRGAYPLIATALLAAGFVLIAMRPGGPAEQSRLIRPLVLVWTGQNILLVISSILRLDLYVAAYSLLVLYGCCFVNAPRVVASYNVEHCREAGGTGLNLDLKYLFSLGPQILPVVEPRLQKISALQPYVAGFRFDYEARSRPVNWRAWGFRAWRLERYLSNNPDTPSNSSDSGKG